MKKNLHPGYHPKAKITCVCGQNFVIGSTMEGIRVEICSSCHPFYTGQQKLVDTAGRIDRFKKRLEKTEEKKIKAEERKKKAQRKIKKEEKDEKDKKDEKKK